MNCDLSSLPTSLRLDARLQGPGGGQVWDKSAGLTPNTLREGEEEEEEGKGEGALSS